MRSCFFDFPLDRSIAPADYQITWFPGIATVLFSSLRSHELAHQLTSPPWKPPMVFDSVLRWPLVFSATEVDLELAAELGAAFVERIRRRSAAPLQPQRAEPPPRW
eukprot:9808458-Prorocentrum_lima.AAC.1